MNATRKVKLNEIMENLTCGICKGYVIEATTIIECLHSFCRSCIVNHLEKCEFCPICEVQLHTSKPLTSIRSDQMLQEIVYKLVPGLFQKEMDRRRSFYEKNSDKVPLNPLDAGQAFNDTYITSDDIIHLSLEYHTNDAKFRESTKRYIKCVAAVSITILKKLIQGKYDLEKNAQIDIMFGDRVLPDDFLLMDIAYKYSWTQNGNKPLPLSYRIKGVKFDKPPYTTKASKTKIPKATPTPKSKRDALKSKPPKDQLTQTPPPKLNGLLGNGKLPSSGKITKKSKGAKLSNGVSNGTQTPVKDGRIVKIPKPSNKKPKTTVASSQSDKEVQLQISENGIISARAIDSNGIEMMGETLYNGHNTPCNPLYETQLKIPNPFNKLSSNSAISITPILPNGQKMSNGVSDLKRKLPFNLSEKETNGPSQKKIKISELESPKINKKLNLKKGLSLSESKIPQKSSGFPFSFPSLEKAKINLFPEPKEKGVEAIPILMNGHGIGKVNPKVKKPKSKLPTNSLVNGSLKFHPVNKSNGNGIDSPPKKPPKFFKSRHSVSSSTSSVEGSPISNGKETPSFKTPEKSESKSNNTKLPPSSSTTLPTLNEQQHQQLVNFLSATALAQSQLPPAAHQGQGSSATSHLNGLIQAQLQHQQQQAQAQHLRALGVNPQALNFFNNFVPLVTSNYCSMPFRGVQTQPQAQFFPYQFVNQFQQFANLNSNGNANYSTNTHTTTTSTHATQSPSASATSTSTISKIPLGSTATSTITTTANIKTNGIGVDTSIDLSKSLASLRGKSLLKTLNKALMEKDKASQNQPLSLTLNNHKLSNGITTEKSEKSPKRKSPPTKRPATPPISIPIPSPLRLIKETSVSPPNLVGKSPTPPKEVQKPSTPPIIKAKSASPPPKAATPPPPPLSKAATPPPPFEPIKEKSPTPPPASAQMSLESPSILKETPIDQTQEVPSPAEKVPEEIQVQKSPEVIPEKTEASEPKLETSEPEKLDERKEDQVITMELSVVENNNNNLVVPLMEEKASPPPPIDLIVENGDSLDVPSEPMEVDDGAVDTPESDCLVIDEEEQGQGQEVKITVESVKSIIEDLSPLTSPLENKSPLENGASIPTTTDCTSA